MARITKRILRSIGQATGLDIEESDLAEIGSQLDELARALDESEVAAQPSDGPARQAALGTYESFCGQTAPEGLPPNKRPTGGSRRHEGS